MPRFFLDKKRYLRRCGWVKIYNKLQNYAYLFGYVAYYLYFCGEKGLNV